MIMKERLKAKRAKNGFTLVELVIVIAILAILAAIAIPVITTTINSAKMSVLESDSATVEMIFKEALAAYKTDIKTTYKGKPAKTATLSEVLEENNIDLKIMSKRKIGGIDYCIYWDNATEGTVIKSGMAASTLNLGKHVYDLGTL